MSDSAAESLEEKSLTFVDPWDRPPGFWERDVETGKRLAWRPRLWWDTYESERDEWLPLTPEEPLTRLFVDPAHGIRLHDPAKTWFEPLTMDTHRVAVLRMKATITGDGGLIHTLRYHARFTFNIGCMEWACAVLGDIESWYEFRPALYIPPHQSFDGMLQVNADVARAVDASSKKVSVRVTLDIREGREVL